MVRAEVARCQADGEQGETDVSHAAVEVAAGAVPGGGEAIDGRMGEGRAKCSVHGIERSKATLEIEATLGGGEGIGRLTEIGRQALVLGDEIAASQAVAFGNGRLVQ